ncbi:methyltetrahydrofolate cobalamin methyltransferase [soil metagenome]
MKTVIKSPTKSVNIGPNEPFVIIGERINPTGRKKLEAEMMAGDFSRVLRDAKAQMLAGAHILDVNVGVTSIQPHKTEPDLMIKVIELIQSVTDIPLCIDSSVVPALIAGIKVAKGRPLINSVTGEEERLEAVLPVVAEYNLPVIAISNDESGISYDPRVRFAVAKKIVERAESYCISRDDVIIDPLAMPVGAVRTAGADLFTLVRMIREELGCNTMCGASNISFGLPQRQWINSSFISMAIASGMTCAITNPLEEHIRNAIYAADVLMGHDEDCMRYLTAIRKADAGARAAANEASGDAPIADAGEDRRAAREARRAARTAR